MRVLFLPLVGGYGLGPITQCLALADEAKSRGHAVAFLCQPTYRLWVEAGTIQHTAPLPTLQAKVIPKFFKLADAALALGLADIEFVRASVDLELQAISDFRPDLLVSKIKLSAPISARIAGLPLVSTAMWADHPNFTSPLYERSASASYVTAVYNQALHEYVQDPIDDIGELSFLRSDLKIAPSSPRLDPGLMQVKNLHYVGYLLYRNLEVGGLPEWLQQWVPSTPLIYVYLGTGDVSLHMYTQVLPQTFDGTGFYVVVSVAGDPQLSDLPQSTSNIRYVGSTPGLATMRKSKLVIHHGGSNTAVGRFSPEYLP